jgi:thioredoxin-dependent peroxiredoxin
MSPSTAPLRAGDVAPDFQATDERGASFRLSDYLGRPIVLFFYPKANSRGCTQQACSFRDAHQEFQDAGADVIGISRDDPAEQSTFATRNALPYRLASDADGTIHAQYGLRKTLGVLPRRVTFVIDPSGVVVHTFASLVQLDQHVQEALRALHLPTNSSTTAVVRR